MHLCLDSGEPLDHVPMLHVRLAKYIIHEKYVMITHSRGVPFLLFGYHGGIILHCGKKWSSFVAKKIEKTNKSKHDIEAMETTKGKECSVTLGCGELESYPYHRLQQTLSVNTYKQRWRCESNWFSLASHLCLLPVRLANSELNGFRPGLCVIRIEK